MSQRHRWTGYEVMVDVEAILIRGIEIYVNQVIQRPSSNGMG